MAFLTRSQLFVTICGLVLCVASLAKAREICVGCPDLCIAQSCGLTAIFSFLEGILGLSILMNRRTRFGQLAGLITFSILTFVVFGQVLMNESSCGCFGRSRVSPVLMLIVDGTILIGLIWSTPSTEIQKSRFSLGRLVMFSAAYFCAWIAVIAFVQIESRSGDGLVKRNDFVYLSSEDWVGKDLIWFDQLVESPIPIGCSRLVFVRGGCPKCEEYIESIEQEESESGMRSVCFIVLPPSAGISAMLDAKSMKRLAVDEDLVWVMNTPVSVEFRDNAVVRVDSPAS